MVDCALCLFVSPGCHAYESLRINILDVLSNLTTIQVKVAKEGFRALKGKNFLMMIGTNIWLQSIQNLQLVLKIV